MKVYISCDIEGISDLSKVDLMYPENLDMEKRRLVTQDVNAAIDGALEAGAEIIEADHPNRLPAVRLDPLVVSMVVEGSNRCSP